MMTTDPETGLPELPEGYFWRIQKWRDTWTGGRVAIAIMKLGTRRKWFKEIPWAHEFASADIYALEIEQDTNPEGVIRGIAEQVYERAEKKWLGEKQRDRIEALYGDYPPKKLS